MYMKMEFHKKTEEPNKLPYKRMTIKPQLPVTNEQEVIRPNLRNFMNHIRTAIKCNSCSGAK
jgi:hypothetical protein